MVRDITDISNYYGTLSVSKKEGKFYWGIEDYNSMYWEEIPKYLFDALNRHQDERGKEA